MKELTFFGVDALKMHH